jgi:hypothetical protein
MSYWLTVGILIFIAVLGLLAPILERRRRRVTVILPFADSQKVGSIFTFTKIEGHCAVRVEMKNKDGGRDYLAQVGSPSQPVWVGKHDSVILFVDGHHPMASRDAMRDRERVVAEVLGPDEVPYPVWRTRKEKVKAE